MEGGVGGSVEFRMNVRPGGMIRRGDLHLGRRLNA